MKKSRNEIDTADILFGKGPLVISIPHDGRDIPADIGAQMTDAGRANGDCDWNTRQLYAFAAELDATLIAANYSRYVVDLNRPADDAPLYPGADETSLCPISTFAGQPIYKDGHNPDAAEIARRLELYWRPYHAALSDALDRAIHRHGYALLWDGHSIAAQVPRFFDGTLPDINLGTADGLTASEDLTAKLQQMAIDAGYTAVVNGRFKGGFITRSYGTDERPIRAIQLELSQAAYLVEGQVQIDPDAATRVQRLIRKMLNGYTEFHGEFHEKLDAQARMSA